MKTFINAKDVKRTFNPQLKSCENFIEKMNAKIEEEPYSNVYHINDILDEAFLLEDDFQLCKLEAGKQGWILTQSPDNYQSTTYTLKIRSDEQ